MNYRHKITFLRSPGVETISTNAEKLGLLNGIDDISTTTFFGIINCRTNNCYSYFHEISNGCLHAKNRSYRNVKHSPM